MPEVHPLLARLIDERKARGISQTAVAKHIGISKSAVCEMERGHHEPKMRTFIGYAEVLGHRFFADDNDPAYEYTQGTCDVWEIHRLCNHFHWEGGWEPLFAVESHEGVQLPERIQDENGPQRKYKPLRPYTVLFRRPLSKEAEL